jgi:hypothetical protein
MYSINARKHSSVRDYIKHVTKTARGGELAGLSLGLDLWAVGLGLDLPNAVLVAALHGIITIKGLLCLQCHNTLCFQ